MSETDTEVIPKLCNYIYSSAQEKVPFHEVSLRCPIQDICKYMQAHLLSLMRRLVHASQLAGIALPCLSTIHTAEHPDDKLGAAGAGGAEQVRGRIWAADQERALPWRAGGLQARLSAPPGCAHRRTHAPDQPQAPPGRRRRRFRGIHCIGRLRLCGAHQPVSAKLVALHYGGPPTAIKHMQAVAAPALAVVNVDFGHASQAHCHIPDGNCWHNHDAPCLSCMTMPPQVSPRVLVLHGPARQIVCVPVDCLPAG